MEHSVNLGRSTPVVLSIPAGHVYPATIRPRGIHFLPDPDINGHWWPHPALDAQWWEDPENSPSIDGIDLVHIHFGFDHLSSDEVIAFVAALQARGIPLVFTVHDLDNPHLKEQDEHHKKVSILVEAADVVITLTEAAATVLPEDTRVIPHPRVVANQQASREDNAIVGIFLKSLRGNIIDDADFYRSLAAGVNGELRIFAHETERARPLIEQLPGLIVHEPMPDAQLYSAISECTVVVLPYIRGTHSGWLEMCRDLHVSVAAPDCGCYQSQADDPEAVITYRTRDAREATQAVNQLLAQGRISYQGDRDEQLNSIRATHNAIYQGVMSR